MEDKKETVGAASVRLAAQSQDERNPIEIEREAHTEYEKNVLMAVEGGKKAYQTDFFVVVITKKEKLMQNVLRNLYFHCPSCPTPDYDQAVYHYIKDKDALDFLWVIPSKDTCVLFKQNQHAIVPEEWALLRYVLQFADGTLYKLAKRLNKEEL